jgi:hexokinase
MSKGLRGGKSSLSMIPTFARMPTGREKGRFIALDLGGTNFRIMEVALNGRGGISVMSEKRFRLKNRDITGTQERLFDFIALSVRRFMRSNRIGIAGKTRLGFTFSFPVRQRSISDGILLCWNKGFAAKNVVGRDVVGLLDKALRRNSVNNIRVAALINDTVGTLVTRRYSDRNCDLGVIIGTGTNASYPEKTRLGQAMNIEWGNFNKLPRTVYDRRLDKSTANPGRQILEKMVSGMYLGEIARLILGDTLGDKAPAELRRPWKFSAEQVALAGRGALYHDRPVVKKVCAAVSQRSARIIAAAIAAVILWMDPKLKNNHTVAIDGSLFEKWPEYRGHIKSCLGEILGGKSAKVSLKLTRNGSGKGAAVVAAVAAATASRDRASL